MSVDTARKWERAFAKKEQKLIQTSTNLVDEVWKDRPPAEINPVIVHPLEFAGCSVSAKLKDLREKLMHEKAHGIILAALDEVISFMLAKYFPHTFVLSGKLILLASVSFLSLGCLLCSLKIIFSSI